MKYRSETDKIGIRRIVRDHELKEAVDMLIEHGFCVSKSEGRRVYHQLKEQPDQKCKNPDCCHGNVITKMATNEVNTVWGKCTDCNQQKELKPCPFCGIIPIFDFDPDTNNHWFVCITDGCIGSGPVRKNKKQAIIAWNTRNDAGKE